MSFRATIHQWRTSSCRVMTRAFSGHSSPSKNAATSLDIVQVKNPRAVVILLGWWGAERRQVDKYGKIYQDAHCSTIVGVADKYALLWKDDKKLSRLARECTLETARILQPLLRNNEQETEIPVIFHVFSNGGCFVLEHVERLLLQETADKNTSPVDDDLQLVRHCLRGQTFDSSPAFVSRETSIAALEGAFSNPLVFQFLKAAVHLQYMFQFLRNKIFQQTPWPETFWNHFVTSDLGSSSSGSSIRQAYIYSSSDHVTDSNKLEELIQARQRSHPVSVLRFSDSDHVQHLLRHRDEYSQFVKEFVQKVVDEARE